MRFREIQWDSEEELSLFVEEATELLTTLEEGALETPPPINAMFRAAHTLKGSGGMLGLTEWVERAHRLEDAMDRRGKSDWQWTPELQQLTLDTVDALRAELEGRDPSSGHTAWELVWEESAAMPGVRAYQAWAAVNALVPGTKSEPPDTELGSWTGTVSRLWVPASRVALETIADALRAIPELQRAQPLDPSAEQPAPREDTAADPRDAIPRAASEPREATLRISADTLESILEGLGEVLLDHGQIEHRLKEHLDPATRGMLDHLRRRALDLQDLTLRARMLPLDTLFRQYPRAVHDIARKLDKKIRLEAHGGETELDRVVMDRLHEPLLHLIRNSCDHGVESADLRQSLGKPETGTIRLEAFAAQGHVHIKLSDDGAGINWEKLRDKAVWQGWMSQDDARSASEEQLSELLFTPGVSTADTVSDISGRGVGLDAVRAFLDDIHGSIHVESVPGDGTTFHLELPMTMAIMTALMVQAGSWTVGFPIAAVERIEDIRRSGLASVLGRDAVPDGEAPLPVYALASLLDPASEHQSRYIVRIKDGRSQAALAVDGVLGQQEVVIKPVDGLSGLTPWLSGVSLLGDGRLALMADARRLLPTASESPEGQPPEENPMTLAGGNQMELLVFFLSDGQHYGINVYKTREVLPAQAVTHVPGQHDWLDGFLHIRGQTIPVINLHRALGVAEAEAAPEFFLITEFNQRVQAFGVRAVDRMVRVGWDQVEPLPSVLNSDDARQFTGFVDVAGMGPVQLPDFEQLLASLAPPEFPEAMESPEPVVSATVWIADDSKAARLQIRRALSPLGLTQRLFEDGEALWAEVEASRALPALFIIDVEMPKLDGYTLAARLKSHAQTQNIPVMLHTSLSGQWHADRAERLAIDAVVTKFEPDVLASTVRQLIQSQNQPDTEVFHGRD